jgi:hypothetical protein
VEFLVSRNILFPVKKIECNEIIQCNETGEKIRQNYVLFAQLYDVSVHLLHPATCTYDVWLAGYMMPCYLNDVFLAV